MATTPTPTAARGSGGNGSVKREREQENGAPTPASGSGGGGPPPGVMVFDGYQQRSVKRPRPVKSCTECRSRKLRCDRLANCSQCQKGHRICRYASDQVGTGGGDAHFSDDSDGESTATGSAPAAVAVASAGGAGEGPAQKRMAVASAPGSVGSGARSQHPRSLGRGDAASAPQSSMSPRDATFAPNAAGGLPVPGPGAGSGAPNGVFVDDAAAQYYRSGFEDISSRLERLERAIMAQNNAGGSTPAPTPGSRPTRTPAPAEWGSGNAVNGTVPGADANGFGPGTTAATASSSVGEGGGVGEAPAAARSSSRSRPLSSSRVNTMPVTVRGLTIKGSRSLRTRFFGQNSTRVLLNLFDEAKDFMYNKAKRESARDMFGQLQAIYSGLQEEQHRSLAPITVFVDSVLPVLKRMADILPKKAVCDRLLDAYVGTSEGLYRVVHVPTFRTEYQAYWDSGGGTGGGSGTGVRRCSDGFLPQLLCMLSIGSRFETESRGLGRDRSEGVHVPTACALVRAWLDGLRGKQLVDVGTLLAEVLLLHAQRMVAPRFQDSWTQLGLIVRMAMTMGLHRDPSEFAQISPFAAESRRKLWYTIMDMDLHISLGCNLPCAVRDGEYTCRPPLNLDDDELRPDARVLPAPRAIDVHTDGQLQAYAASTLPLRMRAAALVSRLDTIRDYTEVLEIGSRLEGLLDDINCLFPRNQSLDPRGKYKEWRMRALLDMHIRRPLLALYRPFALSTPDCPPQISSAYLKSSMILLTYMDELDARTPGFADVNHMYHIILKHDIIQAAFSVCYYIRNANESTATATPNNGGGGGGGGGASSLDTPAPTPQSSGGGHPSSSNGGWNAAMSPGSSDGGHAATATYSGGANYNQSQNNNGSGGGGSYFDGVSASTGRPIWSAERMTRVVEKTLEDLILFIRDSTSDLKDIIALSIVIKSVQPGGTPEQRLERIKDGIRRILEACLHSLKGSGSGLDVVGVGVGAVGVGAHGQGGLGPGSVFPSASAPIVDSRTPLPDQPFPQSSNQPSVLPFEMAAAGFPDEFPLWDLDFWSGPHADPT